MKLYHYFEKDLGPFLNLSDISPDNAKKVLNGLKIKNETFAAKRGEDYIKNRLEYESQAHKIFLEKKGEISRKTPHYMTVESCDWLKSWYKVGCSLNVDIELLNVNTISFTYGDMFPVFGPKGDNNLEYRKQVYTYKEIVTVIEKYGFPQVWNINGEKGPIRYIEAQIWSDKTVHDIKKLSNFI